MSFFLARRTGVKWSAWLDNKSLSVDDVKLFLFSNGSPTFGNKVCGYLYVCVCMFVVVCVCVLLFLCVCVCVCVCFGCDEVLIFCHS